MHDPLTQAGPDTTMSESGQSFGGSSRERVQVTVPTVELQRRLAELRAPADVEIWDMVGPPPPPGRFDLVVPPYMSSPELLESLAEVPTSVVQSQSIGYDGVRKHLPEHLVFCNAGGVHEASTAELALALAVAVLRGIPTFVRSQDRSEWGAAQFTSLADRRVLVLGYGGVGRAVADRFRPFEVELRVVGRSRRQEDGILVHGIDELDDLLPWAEVVVLAVPLSSQTSGLVDDGFLGRLAPGTLLVNVSRGAVVDTDALVRAVRNHGILAALDVCDPEPLPANHPLWQLEGVMITPHVGGNSTAMTPRIARLVAGQIQRLVRGEELANVVISPERR